MNKKGFTLIELLAVVVILVIIFLISTPKILDVIKEANTTNKTLIEEKIIAAGKEYVTDYNKELVQSFINVGDTGYISTNELIDAGLIDSDEVNSLDGTVTVKVVLGENDILTYSIIYS